MTVLHQGWSTWAGRASTTGLSSSWSIVGVTAAAAAPSVATTTIEVRRIGWDDKRPRMFRRLLGRAGTPPCQTPPCLADARIFELLMSGP